MLKSIVWKEFRELLPLLISVFVVEAYLIASWKWPMFQWPQYVDEVWTILFLIGLVFPLVLGLWQSSRESPQNTFQFILHRPMRREAFFSAKLAVGGAACVVLIALPILLYTLWVEKLRGGTEYKWPIGAALASGSLLIYGGAFLSMLRPARPWGSQFFPLLGAIMLFILLTIACSVAWMIAPRWLVVASSLNLLLVVLFVVTILHVANTRDYS